MKETKKMQEKLKLVIEHLVSESIKKLKEGISDNLLLVEVCHLYSNKIYGTEADKIQHSLDNFAVSIDEIISSCEERIKQSVAEIINNLP